MTEHDESLESSEDQLDLNTATVDELRQLPGIGPTLAARIVDYREEVQPFAEPTELARVPGITEGVSSRIAGQLTTGSSTPSETLGSVPDESEAETPFEDEPVMEPVGEAPKVVSEIVSDPLLEDSDLEDEAPDTPLPMADELPEAQSLGPEGEVEFEDVTAVEPELAIALDDEELEGFEVEALPIADLDQEPVEAGEAATNEWETKAAGAEGDLEELEVEALPIAEPDPDLVEPEDSDVHEPSDEPESSAEPPLVAIQPVREGHWGRLFAFALLGAFGGALLAFVALYLINGTVNYRTATDRAIRAEAFRVDGEIDAVAGNVDQLRARLDAMQDLAQRLDDAEAQVRHVNEELARLDTALQEQSEELVEQQASLAGLSEDVSELGDTAVALLVQVSVLEEQIATLTAEVDAIREAAQRFDAFLSGLRLLLDETGAGLPETGPFRSGQPAPTSRPVLTVIPLATPTP